VWNSRTTLSTAGPLPQVPLILASNHHLTNFDLYFLHIRPSLSEPGSSRGSWRRLDEWLLSTGPSGSARLR